MIEAMRETAWAKINLALHVRARRPDGYHDIETLFAFVDGGDALTATVGDVDSLAIDGPFAECLAADGRNLVLQTLSLMRGHFGADRIPPLAMALDKILPVSAGLGGGSADAAALARLVRTHFLPEVPDSALIRLTMPVGADIGACVASETCLGLGTGSDLQPASDLALGGTPVLLVNPRQPLVTGPVFAGWDGIDRGSLFAGAEGRAQLFGARNDLQRSATAQCPAIAAILITLGEFGPWLARMSGSGASCFALFDAATARDHAAAVLARTHPHWWVMAGSLR